MKMTVSEKIRILMKRQDKTLSDLAAATGQTRQNLSNKMNRDNFSEKEIQALAEALGCTVQIKFISADGAEL